MATDVKISELTSIPTLSVSGSVVLPSVASGTTYKITLDQITTQVSAGLTLGTASTYDVGVGGVAVPLMSNANTWSDFQTINNGIKLRSSPGAGDPEGWVYSTVGGDVIFRTNLQNPGFEANFTFGADGTFSFGAPITVASGGTGAATAAGARTNLGIGAIAVSGAIDTSLGAIVQTGATTWVKRAVGAASSTDILDRAAGDGRYALAGAGGVPTGGTTGQVLTKASATDYDATWTNAGEPTGGTAGQFLKKNSSTDYDSSYATLTVSDISNYASDQTTRAAAQTGLAIAFALSF